MTVGADWRLAACGGGQKGQHGRAVGHRRRWSSQVGYPCGRAMVVAGGLSA